MNFKIHYYLSKIFIQLYVYFIGIKFYCLMDNPKTEPVEQFRVLNDEGQEIIFNFYIEPIEKFYRFYHFGKIKAKDKKTIIITTTFTGEDFPDRITQFKDIKIFISRNTIFEFSNKAWFEVLTNLYLDHIKNNSIDISNGT